MLFNIFLLLMGIGFLLVLSGFAMDFPLLTIVGAVFIIGMGIVVLNDQVEVQNGIVENNVFAEDNTTITSTNTTYTYDTYEFGGVGNITYGWAFLILGMFFMVLGIVSAGD